MEQKSSFRLVFGDTPIIKVLDFFLDNKEFDYSLTDIAKNADIGWTTLHQFWPRLVKLGIVIRTRRIGRAELYKLATNDPLVKRIIDIDNHISKKLMQEELERQKIEILAR